MRIISGIYKSRILRSPDTYKVRPTSDRAKETLFNILASKFDLSGVKCLDLFCGTGSLGLEAISRGAEKCCFVDEDTKWVEQNVILLGAEDKSKIVRSEVLIFAEKIKRNEFDIVFCDPPYSFKYYKELTRKIFNLGVLLVLEHSADFIPEEQYENLTILKKKIGTVNFTLFDFR